MSGVGRGAGSGTGRGAGNREAASSTAVLRWRIRNRVRELFWLPPLPPPTGEFVPPSPRVDVALARCAPGALVRLVPGLLLLGVTGMAGVGGPVVWWIAGVLAVLVTVVPRMPIPAGFALVLGVLVFIGGDLLAQDPDTGAVGELWRVALLVAGVHAVIAAAALAEHVAWRSLVELGVLWRTARSVLAVQAIAQTLVLFAGWLRAVLVGAESQELVRLLGLVAVLALALTAFPSRWLRKNEDGSAVGD